MNMATFPSRFIVEGAEFAMVELSIVPEGKTVVCTLRFRHSQGVYLTERLTWKPNLEKSKDTAQPRAVRLYLRETFAARPQRSGIDGQLTESSSGQ